MHENVGVDEGEPSASSGFRSGVTGRGRPACGRGKGDDAIGGPGDASGLGVRASVIDDDQLPPVRIEITVPKGADAALEITRCAMSRDDDAEDWPGHSRKSKRGTSLEVPLKTPGGVQPILAFKCAV